MKPKEQLKKLGKIYLWSNEKFGTTTCIKDLDEFTFLIPIIDEYEILKAKNKPMKPVISNGIKVCPKCFSPAINGSIYDPHFRQNKYFCPEKDCGQAIDWSEIK